MAFDDIIGKVEKLSMMERCDIVFEDIKDRVGRFSISNDYIVNSPDIILKIMRDMIIIEADPKSGNINYLAYSIRFDMVPNIKHGDDAPVYNILVTSDGTIEYHRS